MMSYRLYGREDGLSEFGHAMFTDNPSEVDGGYGHGGYHWFSVDSARLTNIDDLREAILAARRNTNAEEFSLAADAEDWERLMKPMGDDEFFDMFNPADIVDSAGAYDDSLLIVWLWERVLEPMGIYGVKTQDGAVCYGASLYTRIDSPWAD